MAETARRPGRKRNDPLKVRRDKAGRILETAARTGGELKRQAQAQRFRQLGAEGVLDPRLGSTLGLMFVLGVPVKIGPQEYDAASWLADRLKAYDELVLALRRSPPSNAMERGTGGTRLNALELQAIGKVDEVVDAEARRMLDQVVLLRKEIAGAKSAMGGGTLGRLRWEALTAACRSEGLPTGDMLRRFVEGAVELAWTGGFYEHKRRRARNQKAAWGHDEHAVEIIRVVQGDGDGKKS